MKRWDNEWAMTVMLWMAFMAFLLCMIFFG
jgi:hypothetical protein